MIDVAAAANTEVPCYLALLALGFEVALKAEGDRENWSAKKAGVQITADSPCNLLGLAAMVEVRGADWRANDDEIDEFLGRFETRSN